MDSQIITTAPLDQAIISTQPTAILDSEATEPPISTPQSPAKRGRRRLHASDTERRRANRAKVAKLKITAQTILSKHEEIPVAIRRQMSAACLEASPEVLAVIVSENQDMAQGQYLRNAGIIVSGGYGPTHAAEVIAAARLARKGRKVSPAGYASDTAINSDDGEELESESREYEDSFIEKQEKYFGNASVPLSGKEYRASLRRLYCATHSPSTADSPDAELLSGIWIRLSRVLACLKTDKKWLVSLDCGCQRELPAPKAISVPKRVSEDTYANYFEES
jgi:hypothetical protein